MIILEISVCLDSDRNSGLTLLADHTAEAQTGGRAAAIFPAVTSCPLQCGSGP